MGPEWLGAKFWSKAAGSFYSAPSCMLLKHIICGFTSIPNGASRSDSLMSDLTHPVDHNRLFLGCSAVRAAQLCHTAMLPQTNRIFVPSLNSFVGLFVIDGEWVQSLFHCDFTEKVPGFHQRNTQSLLLKEVKEMAGIMAARPPTRLHRGYAIWILDFAFHNSWWITNPT